MKRLDWKCFWEWPDKSQTTTQRRMSFHWLWMITLWLNSLNCQNNIQTCGIRICCVVWYVDLLKWYCFISVSFFLLKMQFTTHNTGSIESWMQICKGCLKGRRRFRNQSNAKRKNCRRSSSWRRLIISLFLFFCCLWILIENLCNYSSNTKQTNIISQTTNKFSFANDTKNNLLFKKLYNYKTKKKKTKVILKSNH